MIEGTDNDITNRTGRGGRGWDRRGSVVIVMEGEVKGLVNVSTPFPPPTFTQKKKRKENMKVCASIEAGNQ